METGDEITVEAEVHDEGGPRRSGRTPVNNTPAPVNKVPKKRGPKPKDPNSNSGKNDTSSNSGKRLTVNALASIVNEMQKANDSRADHMEREMRNNSAVLKGLGDAIERLASSLPANNNVPAQASVVTPQAPATPAAPANLVVAGQRPHATSPVQPHVPQATPPAPPPAAALPPPQTLVRQENADGALDRIIAKEDYKSTSSHGKNNYNELGMAKPYMFIYRQDLQTPKQKLDVRASLSMIEYVNSTLLLLQDSDAYRHEDLKPILAHLTAVTTDAMVRPWSAVRAWSQYIWDCIERGKCTWTSYQFIQDERVRMSFISGTPSGNSASANSVPKSHSHDIKVVLCRDYNSVSGCRHHGTHEDQTIKYLHACAHCDAMGRRSSHSYQRCRSKLDGGAYPGHGSQDNRQWHHGNGRHHHGGQGGENQYGHSVGYRNGGGGQAHGSSKNA